MMIIISMIDSFLNENKNYDIYLGKVAIFFMFCLYATFNVHTLLHHMIMEAKMTSSAAAKERGTTQIKW